MWKLIVLNKKIIHYLFSKGLLRLEDISQPKMKRVWIEISNHPVLRPFLNFLTEKACESGLALF